MRKLDHMIAHWLAFSKDHRKRAEWSQRRETSAKIFRPAAAASNRRCDTDRSRIVNVAKRSAI